jgi:hypothetical protein
MDVNFWSVPIESQSTVVLPGTYRDQWVHRTTTKFNLRERSHHTMKVSWLNPRTLLSFLAIVLFIFIPGCVFTLFVPGILATIMKDKTPTWIFPAWAIVVLIIAAAVSRKAILERLMARHALKELGLSAKTKIKIVPDRRWDRWAAKLK